MKQSYNYILSQIDTANTPFRLDCCKVMTELFFMQYRNEELYQNLLGFILEKY